MKERVLFARIEWLLDPYDFMHGMLKAIVFGVLIALVGCYKGYMADGGARGVGMATTQAVVIGSISVLLSTIFSLRCSSPSRQHELLMIVIDNLHKSFNGQPVLKGISMHIKRGRTRVILGLSGSGKSVLMKHIIGLMRPDSGSITIDDEDVTKFDDRRLLGVRAKVRHGLPTGCTLRFDVRLG